MKGNEYCQGYQISQTMQIIASPLGCKSYIQLQGQPEEQTGKVKNQNPKQMLQMIIADCQ